MKTASSRNGVRGLQKTANGAPWRLDPSLLAPATRAALARPPLSHEDAFALGREAAQNGPGAAAAREALVVGNLRLAMMHARRLHRPGLLLTTRELFQEAVPGLMIAAERFDPARGPRFSTYASYWIAHHIRRALANRARVIRLPVHAYEFAGKLERMRMWFRHEHGQDPSSSELSSLLQTNEAKVLKMLRLYEVTKVAWLDASPNPDMDPWVDMIPDTGERGRFFFTDVSVLHSPSMLSLFVGVPPVPREMFWLRALGWKEKPIGERFSLTRERARQIIMRVAYYLRWTMRGHHRLSEAQHAYLSRAMEAARNARMRERVMRIPRFRPWLWEREGGWHRARYRLARVCKWMPRRQTRALELFAAGDHAGFGRVVGPELRDLRQTLGLVAHLAFKCRQLALNLPTDDPFEDCILEPHELAVFSNAIGYTSPRDGQ